MSTFRQSARATRAGSVRYGPFHVRVGRIAGALVALVLGVVFVFVSLAETRLTCDRSGACVVDGRRPRPFSFPQRALRTVRVDVVTGSKGAKTGHPVLVFDTGAELRLMGVDPPQAHAFADAVSTPLAKGEPIDARLRGPRWMLLATLAALAASASLGWGALAALGRYRLDIVQEGTALRVQRRVLGVPGRARVLPLEHLKDVTVELGELPDFWLSRGQAPSPAGRVVLHYEDRSRRELADAQLIGAAVHLRAASELRALLELAPLPGGVEEQLARLPPRTTATASRFAHAWIGFIVGTVAGIGVLGAVVTLAGAARMSDALGPWTVAVGCLCGGGTGLAVALHATRLRPPL